jgi:hypothetical protein
VREHAFATWHDRRCPHVVTEADLTVLFAPALSI